MIRCYKAVHILQISKMQGHSQNSLPTRPESSCRCRSCFLCADCVHKVVLCKIGAGAKQSPPHVW